MASKPTKPQINFYPKPEDHDAFTAKLKDDGVPSYGAITNTFTTLMRAYTQNVIPDIATLNWALQNAVYAFAGTDEEYRIFRDKLLQNIKNQLDITHLKRKKEQKERILLEDPTLVELNEKIARLKNEAKEAVHGLGTEKDTPKGD
ncbi:hypothetical protein ACL02S_23300 [Nocardia sp. 004]|uniref:hypothetical protein n=1 Tax=Nocardia sp. 004 TaxID=3385978 RepID=UPI0039A063F5